MTDLAAILDDLRECGRYREMRVIETAQGSRVSVDGNDALLMCSDDYLGLAAHPVVRAAAADAAERWGRGRGRLVSRNMVIHRRLERELAEFKGYDACVLVGSGYLRSWLAGGRCDVSPGEMPIVPLIVGDPGEAVALCEAALRSGVFAQAIRPPTVPDGTSRLRIVTTAAHTETDIRQATAVLTALPAKAGFAATRDVISNQDV